MRILDSLVDVFFHESRFTLADGSAHFSRRTGYDSLIIHRVEFSLFELFPLVINDSMNADTANQDNQIE